jgi:serine phosphatase RsbU (regulator of sigma subunit)/uncharacterized protein YigA (DUF484 family)
MKDRFYQYQKEITLRNLSDENTRLKKEIQRLEEQADTHGRILDFHDRLERDFFSADSLEDLIIKLINCLQLRPDIDFVSLCLTRQYLESMLGSLGYEQFLHKIGAPTKLGYLSIIDEGDLSAQLDPSLKTLAEKTPKGSLAIFFPDHDDEVRSHVIIPLVLRRQIVGTLNLGSIRSRHFYTFEMGPGLLDRLSAKLTIAIDNILSHKKLALQKEILDRDINRAAILQKSLLPHPLFQSEALEIVAHFQPCQRLGGDFYDLITFSPDRLAIVIADVAGHGISAALIAAMLKFSLQLDDIETLSPAELLSRINRKFCQIFKHDDYITLCYGLIDLKTRRVTLARAGHPYPLLCRSASGEVRDLKTSGPPLGLDAEAHYEEMEIELGPGDSIFFYTDGLTEALARRGQPCDLRRFIHLLGEKVRAGHSMESLLPEIGGLTESEELEDDTSLLVMRIK